MRCCYVDVSDIKFTYKDLKLHLTITRMVGLIAFGRPDSFIMDEKTYASKFKPTYQTFGTVTTLAAETKSMGLPADAHAVMVFASPPRQFYRDGTNSCHLSGLGHLDNFIVTRKSCPLTGTLQKLMPTPTQTTTPHTTEPLVLICLFSAHYIVFKN